jgi:DNA-directed RNA polymerase subunit F
MTKAAILSEEPISVYDLKKELAVIKNRDKELGFRAAKTEEYLAHFAKLDDKKVAELKKKIEELNIPRLKSEHVCKMLDVLPADVEDVKSVLQAYSVTITNDNVKKIADVISEYKK